MGKGKKDLIDGYVGGMNEMEELIWRYYLVGV